MKSKYYIDEKLLPQRPWDVLGLQPDDIEWISEDSNFSAGDKDSLMKVVDSLLGEYREMLHKECLLRSKKLRSKARILDLGKGKKAKGHPLTDSEVNEMQNWKKIVDDKVASYRKQIERIVC